MVFMFWGIVFFTFNPRCAIITTWKRRLTVKRKWWCLLQYVTRIPRFSWTCRTLLPRKRKRSRGLPKKNPSAFATCVSPPRARWWRTSPDCCKFATEVKRVQLFSPISAQKCLKNTKYLIWRKLNHSRRALPWMLHIPEAASASGMMRLMVMKQPQVVGMISK